MLSKRLLALADFIDDNEIVADIGSDHALLLCYLADRKRLVKGYAIDIAKGPLKQAKKNITEAKHNNIDCLLAFGLSELPQDTTVVVIAGMGYKTIKDILTNDWDKLQSISYVIIQCNSQISLLRRFLAERQVNITDELWVKDYKDYQLIKFNIKKKKDYLEKEIYFGPCLLKKKQHDFISYYKKHYSKLLKNYKLSNKEELKKEIILIEENLKDFF